MQVKKIIGIYLAAGSSSRFDGNKLSAPVGEIPLGKIALHAALQSNLEKIIVIIKKGDGHSWLSPFLIEKFPTKLEIVPCAEAVKGQAYSIKCGVKEAMIQGASEIMILLADMPYISASLLNQLITIYKDKKICNFVGISHQQIISPPFLFSKTFFPSLLQLSGDKGARHLIRQYVDDGYLLEVTNPDMVFDVDTKEQYDKFTQKMMGNEIISREIKRRMS